MKYYQPIDELDPDASYTNGNLGTGIPGSIPDARAIEHPMREILAVIAAAGITPDEGDLGQLLAAIQEIAGIATSMDANSILANPTNAVAAGQDLIVTANKFLARASTGDLGLKAITDAALAWLASVSTAPRVRLTANRTFYVATTGDDTTGVGSVGAPWATIQRAIDVIAATIDMNGFVATISVADGTYSHGANITRPFVGGKVLLQGNLATPANCIISTSVSGENCIYLSNTEISIAGFRLTTSNNASGVVSNNGSLVNISGLMDFASMHGANSTHLNANYGGRIVKLSGYNITGNAVSHTSINWNSQLIVIPGLTFALSGTPAFSGGFITAGYCSTINQPASSFTGSATGPRYVSASNSVIQTNGGGANYYPGSTPGTVPTGGQYY